MPAELRIVYSLAAVVLALGLVAIAFNHARALRRVGRMCVESLPSRGGRLFGAALLLGAGVLAWSARDYAPLVWTLPAFGLALCVQLFRPDERLRVVGEEGLRWGWYARTLANLEEWRLTGDHLRFRLLGIWRAVDLPYTEHPAYRERLVARAADRESSFKE